MMLPKSAACCIKSVNRSAPMGKWVKLSGKYKDLLRSGNYYFSMAQGSINEGNERHGQACELLTTVAQFNRRKVMLQ